MDTTFYIIPRIGGIAYLNISKAACSSILIALSQMRLLKGFKPPRKLLDDGSESIHGFTPPHAYLENFFHRWPLNYPKLPDNFITFTFVRNPYDRFYSFYKSKILAGQKPGKFYEKFGIFKDCKFSECVKIITSIDPNELEHHAIPQSKLICGENELNAQFIGKVENIAEDWEVIKKITGHIIELEHANISNQIATMVYSKESKELIYEYYMDDFKLFGYDKNSVKINDDSAKTVKQPVFKEHLLHDKILNSYKKDIEITSSKVRQTAKQFQENKEKRSRYFLCQQEALNEILLKNIYLLKKKVEKLNKSIATENKSIATEKKKAQLNYLEIKNKIEELTDFNKNTFNTLNKCEKSLIQKQRMIEGQKRDSEAIKKTIKRVMLITYANANKNTFLKIHRFLKYRIINVKKILLRSGLVDPSYYYEHYPDIISSGMSAVEHYVRFGAQEGRNPSENFNSIAYLYENPAVACEGINPLLHHYLNSLNSK